MQFQQGGSYGMRCLKVTQRGSFPRLEFPKTYKQQNFMLIYASARRNLELFSTQFGEKMLFNFSY